MFVAALIFFNFVVNAAEAEVPLYDGPIFGCGGGQGGRALAGAMKVRYRDEPSPPPPPQLL